MSFSSHGVKFNAWHRKNWFFSFVMRATELVLSVMFIIALGGVALMPEQSKAALGVSNILSYQGRLTDASGNALGGSGTNYCAAFSIWDASSGGAKLWPTATSSTTILVTNGVFNAGIGQADDLSTYNFYDNNTTYLEVDVASQVGGTCTGVTWEALAPRPRIDATAYARVARDVYGDLLRTDNGNSKVQIGTGAGAATPILFNLDIKNVANGTLSYVGQTCTVNGTVWYNSASSKALLCENGLVRALANATTTVDALDITGNTAGTPATINAGTITLAGGNNVTLSQNGNAITISGGQSAQTQNLHNVTLSGNTAGVMAQVSSGTMTLAGGANITLSQNGNAITISGGAGGAAGSNTLGMSNLGNTVGTSGVISGSALQFAFAGGNNITLSQSINGSSGTITISAFNQSAQTQNLHNMTLSGNTAGVMAHISSGTMTLAGGNNVTLSQNGNAVTISAFNQTVQTQNLHNVTIASNITSGGAGYMAISSGTLTLAGGNNITLSQDGNAITISGGAGGGGFANYIAAGGVTTNGLNTVNFSNANGVSFGLGAGANSSVMTASVSPGGAGPTVNSTVLGNNRGWAQGSVSLGQNSLYVFPQNLDLNVAVSAIKIPVMVTNSSSAFAAHTRGYTMEFGVYTRNATNSTVLTRHYSTSYTAAFSANSNASWMGSIITGIGNNTSYNTITASSAGLNLSSASFHGPRNFILPFNTTLTQGEYWFAVRNSSSSAGAAGNLFNLSYIIASSQTGNRMGVASNVVSTYGLAQNIGLGTYSATTGAMPGFINMTQINQAGTNPIIYMFNNVTQ